MGGKRRILMADLKEMFSDLGFTDISTYIQSGNVIFKSEDKDRELEARLEKTIKESFGYDVPVIVRSAGELEKAISNNPFYKSHADLQKLHLTFLQQKPSEENKKQIASFGSEFDKFVIDEKDVFIYCEGKYHESKLTNNFFERKLKVGATTRNWKTVLKLNELCRSTGS